MGNRDFHYHYDNTNNSLFYRNKSQGCTLYLEYFHPSGPDFVGIYRDAHRRLHQMVVDIHTQFPLFYYLLPCIVKMIG